MIFFKYAIQPPNYKKKAALWQPFFIHLQSGANNKVTLRHFTALHNHSFNL